MIIYGQWILQKKRKRKTITILEKDKKEITKVYRDLIYSNEGTGEVKYDYLMIMEYE